MTAYYNENNPHAAQWLKNLIDAGHIARGDVDDRSIHDVRGKDLHGYDQCHFFAGIGGWSLALRMAGWPDGRPVWTGSCPCQPFSAVGERRGFADPRHLWPEWLRLIGERHPPIAFGEQSAQATDWIGLVRSDMEAVGYAMGIMPIEAASAGAHQLGDRFWFVAASDIPKFFWQSPAGEQPEHEQDTRTRPRYGRRDYIWRCGADGKKRRVDARIDLLAHGVPGRMGKMRGFGNAITPPAAAAFIAASVEAIRH
jgi:DNA (cytosine-5)-methyltransferase 1